MSEFPGWTEYQPTDEDHQGVYPLGLEAVGSYIVGHYLLPGITDATRHIRYYSFFSWVFWTFFQELRRQGRTTYKRDEFFNWLVRLENVLRAATLDTDRKFIGLIGRSKALTLEDAKNGKLRIDQEVAASGFVPAAYSASFAALHCGQYNGKRAHLTPRGEALGLAFNAQFAGQNGKADVLRPVLSKSSHISVKTIKDIEDEIRIRPVSPDENEHPLLMDMLLSIASEPDGNENELHLARSRTLGLILEMIDYGNGTIAEPDDFHRIFACGRLKGHPKFSPSSEFARECEIWKRYQERQFQKLGLYGLWHEILDFLSTRPRQTAPTSEIVTHMLTHYERSSFLKSWVGESSLSKSVAKADRNILDHVGDHSKLGAAAWSVNEHLHSAASVADRVGSSVVLLLMAPHFWSDSPNDLPHRQLHNLGGRTRLCLSIFADDVHSRQNDTMAQFLFWVIESCVLAQSSRIALDKLARGDFRFFVMRDESGYRLIKAQDRKQSLSFDASRLFGAISLLRSLCLIREDEGLRLTSSGRNTLKKLRIRHEATAT
ncbi:MAG TPA: hypothetical protein VJX30_10580 [Terriglobales bacterium]|nr:hypothetical protein [Terriglobales bacterium]